jgi:hypothetical protein
MPLFLFVWYLMGAFDIKFRHLKLSTLDQPKGLLMKLITITPVKSLNKAYLKQSLKREQVELFKANLARMFERICTDEHEEHLKNIVSDFLKDTWYKTTNEINTSGRADLAIHNGTTSTASVGVLIEVKGRA